MLVITKVLPNSYFIKFLFHHVVQLNKLIYIYFIHFSVNRFLTYSCLCIWLLQIWLKWKRQRIQHI